ncbi:hypothetical protein [Heyndrickxia oleronia]|uniref:hypothetical protein n=1 Tax=Heyndrickxia oleronia TaxID=38875 RepID=UPI0021B1C4DB|nr:hypothetical protein [Heyndrickxia oleronia]
MQKNEKVSPSIGNQYRPNHEKIHRKIELLGNPFPQTTQLPPTKKAEQFDTSHAIPSIPNVPHQK